MLCVLSPKNNFSGYCISNFDLYFYYEDFSRAVCSILKNSNWNIFFFFLGGVGYHFWFLFLILLSRRCLRSECPSSSAVTRLTSGLQLLPRDAGTILPSDWSQGIHTVQYYPLIGRKTILPSDWSQVINSPLIDRR